MQKDLRFLIAFPGKAPFWILCLSATTTFAQGIVNFNNHIAAGGDHGVYICYPNQPVVGTSYLAELYYVDPADSVLKPVPVSISKFRVTSTASPGPGLEKP